MTEDDAYILVRDLFGYTTCKRHIEIVEIIGEYVLVHHRSHRDWVNRMTGVATCEAYHALVSEDYRKLGWRFSAEGAHLFFPGRMNKARIETVYDYCRRNARDGGKNTASEENRGSDSQGKGDA